MWGKAQERVRRSKEKERERESERKERNTWNIVGQLGDLNKSRYLALTSCSHEDKTKLHYIM